MRKITTRISECEELHTTAFGGPEIKETAQTPDKNGSVSLPATDILSMALTENCIPFTHYNLVNTA